LLNLPREKTKEACFKRSFYTNSREGGKTASIDIRWLLAFRLTVFPAD